MKSHALLVCSLFSAFVSASAFSASLKPRASRTLAANACQVYLRSDNSKEYIEITQKGANTIFTVIVKKTGEVIPQFAASPFETEFESYQHVILSDARELLCVVGRATIAENYCVENVPGATRVNTYFLVPMEKRACRVKF